jgi:hypothetical protein
MKQMESVKHNGVSKIYSYMLLSCYRDIRLQMAESDIRMDTTMKVEGDK